MNILRQEPILTLAYLTAQPGFPIYIDIKSLLHLGSLRKDFLYFLLKIIKKENKKKEQHIDSIVCYIVKLWALSIFHIEWIWKSLWVFVTSA